LVLLYRLFIYKGPLPGLRENDCGLVGNPKAHSGSTQLEPTKARTNSNFFFFIWDENLIRMQVSTNERVQQLQLLVLTFCSTCFPDKTQLTERNSTDTAK